MHLHREILQLPIFESASQVSVGVITICVITVNIPCKNFMFDYKKEILLWWIFPSIDLMNSWWLILLQVHWFLSPFNATMLVMKCHSHYSDYSTHFEVITKQTINSSVWGDADVCPISAIQFSNLVWDWKIVLRTILLLMHIFIDINKIWPCT